MGTPICNLALIKPLLNFSSEDDYYLLEVCQRKKENPTMKKNSRIIKWYLISSIQMLDSLMDEITDLCLKNNARAGIRLNRRSFKKTAHRALSKTSEYLETGDYVSVRNAYHKATGDKRVLNSEKTWILDIDKEDLDKLTLIENTINTLSNDLILARIPSKSGIHLITKPFNRIKFIGDWDIEIHKDNPTNLLFF